MQRLGDLTTKIGSGATPRGGKGIYKEFGTAFIRSQNVLDWRMKHAGIARISDSAARELDGVAVEPGDVLINITGDSIARCTVVDPDILPARVSQHVSILRSNGLVEPVYLMAALINPVMKARLVAESAGGTRNALTKGQLMALEIPIPPVDTQRAIAAVLGALENKIAANTALASTADDLAAARFALLTATADIQLQVGDVCAANEKSVAPGVGAIRYIDISSMGTGTTPSPKTLDWPNAPSRARRALQVGDVVWATVRPNREQYFLNLDDDPGLVASTGLIVLTATRVPWTYLYECARQKSFVDQVVAQAEGSAYPAIRPERFLTVLLPLAPQAEIEKFHAFAEPLRHYLHALSKESTSLAELRDTLLPALMSGRLRVKDAERQVEEAV